MQNPIRTLEGLLHHFSPTGDEGSAVNYLVDQMQKFGFQAHVDPIGNAVGTIGSGSREILLLGHIDTVPGEISIRQEENNLFGRGAVDAKGPLASFVCASAAAQIHPDWRITVIGAVGEEGDSRGAKYLCENYQTPEMVIIGEPSGWESITLGYKGSCWMDLIFNQVVSHTASGARSASDQAFSCWQVLLEELSTRNILQKREFDKITPSIRGMQSNQDGFSETAILHINFRVPPGLALEDINNLIESVNDLSHTNPESKIHEFLPAFQSAKNTPLVRAFLAGIRSAGGKPGFKLKTGTSDMNLVGPAWNVPIVAYGAGDSNLDHTPNEHINLSDFLSGIQILTNTLQIIQK